MRKGKPNRPIVCLIFFLPFSGRDQGSVGVIGILQERLLSRVLALDRLGQTFEKVLSHFHLLKDPRTNNFHTDFPKKNQNIGLVLNRMAYLLLVSLFDMARYI